MQRNIAGTRSLITLLIVYLASSVVSAETVILQYKDRGNYTPAGEHVPILENYIVGDSHYFHCYPCANDIRNFFVYDLSNVSQPIALAWLILYVPEELPTAKVFPFSSPDGQEDYELHDVVTPIAALRDGTAGVAAHADLGEGVVYGGRTITAADIGKAVYIPLNSSAIEAMNATHGLFAIGGSITSLDSLVDDEYAFGWTGRGRADETRLLLTLVPEPSTLLLLGIGAISLIGYRKAKPHG